MSIFTSIVKIQNTGNILSYKKSYAKHWNQETLNLEKLLKGNDCEWFDLAEEDPKSFGEK